MTTTFIDDERKGIARVEAILLGSVIAGDEELAEMMIRIIDAPDISEVFFASGNKAIARAIEILVGERKPINTENLVGVGTRFGILGLTLTSVLHYQTLAWLYYPQEVRIITESVIDEYNKRRAQA